MKRIVPVILLTVLSFAVRADVFSLWPFSAGKGGVSDGLNSSQLWEEEVRINGKNMKMQVSLAQGNLAEILKEFKGQGRRLAMNSNSLLVEEMLSNGRRRRFYFVEIPGFSHIVRFSMDLPSSEELHHVARWPKKFPLPSGATPVSVMEFPSRNASYASFRSQTDSVQTVGECDARLRSSGWKSVGKASELPGTGGDVYLNNDASEILILTVTPDSASGASSGAYFLRKNTERP